MMVIVLFYVYFDCHRAKNKVMPAATAPRDLRVLTCIFHSFFTTLWHFIMAMPLLAQCQFVCVFTPQNASQIVTPL